MIEINLLPGAQRRRAGRRLALPRMGRLRVDRWLVAVVLAWIVGPAIVGWLWVGTGRRIEQLTTSIEEARQDSIRYARIIETTRQLQARRDTIAQKLEIIQQIDADRYVWAHIMDEAARALPEYTWLTGIEQVNGGPTPTFRIKGRTGTNFALTRYLTSLESSAFISQVKLSSSRQIEQDKKTLYDFEIEARFEAPEPSVLQTVPLLAAQDLEG